MVIRNYLDFLTISTFLQLQTFLLRLGIEVKLHAYILLYLFIKLKAEKNTYEFFLTKNLPTYYKVTFFHETVLSKSDCLLF